MLPLSNISSSLLSVEPDSLAHSQVKPKVEPSPFLVLRLLQELINSLVLVLCLQLAVLPNRSPQIFQKTQFSLLLLEQLQLQEQETSLDLVAQLYLERQVSSEREDTLVLVQQQFLVQQIPTEPERSLELELYSQQVEQRKRRQATNQNPQFYSYSLEIPRLQEQEYTSVLVLCSDSMVLQKQLQLHQKQQDYSEFLEMQVSSSLFITLVLVRLRSAAMVQRRSSDQHISDLVPLVDSLEQQKKVRLLQKNLLELKQYLELQNQLSDPEHTEELDLYSQLAEHRKPRPPTNQNLQFYSTLLEKRIPTLSSLDIKVKEQSQSRVSQIQNSEYSSLHIRSSRSYKIFRVINKSRKTLGIEI